MDHPSPRPWWRRPITICDLGLYSVDELLGIDPARLAEQKRKLGFNVEHLTSSDTYGGERGVFFFKTRIAVDVPRDFFGEYIPEAHKRGIKVLAYYNVHWLSLEFASKHPSWLQVRSDGTPIKDLYGRGSAPCVNSAWRNWALQGIEDLSKYEIDGIFLDGPIFVADACFCNSCREAFRDRYGYELSKFEKGTKQWRDFVEFRYDSIASFLRDAEATLKKRRPEAVIYMNCTGVSPSWPAARDNRRLMPYQDILGAEGGFLYYDLRKTPLWKPGMTAKLLESQSGGKPTVVFIAGANKGWDEYLLPPAEIRLMYAETVANGANPWFGIPLRLADRPGALAAAEMNRFIQSNSDLFEDTASAARVALLWSGSTADNYTASVPVTDFTPKGSGSGKALAGNFYESFVGAYEALSRCQVPFDVIDEEEVSTGEISRYDLVILPNCACLSQSSVNSLRSFVEAGGGLISTFETSRYDSTGSLLDRPSLSDVMGVEMGSGIFGPMNLDYISLVDSSTPISRGLSSETLPAPTFGIDVRPTTAKALFLYREKMVSRYSPLPPLSERPAILLNQYGRGRSVFIAGNFFEHYLQYHNPDFRLLLENAVRWLSSSPVTVHGSPRSVDLVVRYQPLRRRLLVHLVNLTGEMTRPIERVVPIRDVAISFHRTAGEVRAHARMLGASLKGRPGKNGWEFVLPVLEEYEVVTIEPYDNG